MFNLLKKKLFENQIINTNVAFLPSKYKQFEIFDNKNLFSIKSYKIKFNIIILQNLNN